jgi:hypothetical protein
MIAPTSSQWTHDDADQPDHESEIDPDATYRRAEPVRPDTAARQQAIKLTPPPSKMLLLVGAAGSALIGGGIGFWLGSRRAPRRTRPMRDFASTVGSAAELAPVAMHLLANPLIRAMAVRILLRQIARRVER